MKKNGLNIVFLKKSTYILEIGNHKNKNFYMNNSWENLDKESIDYVKESTKKNRKFHSLLSKLNKAKEHICDSSNINKITQEIK